MAIADPRPQQIEAPTQETGTLPAHSGTRTTESALSMTVPRIAPGRYLAIEDGDDIVLLVARRGADAHRPQSGRGHRARRRVGLAPARADRPGAASATVILDDRSLNGVHVNGVRVSEADLHDGDTIRVGHVTLRFVERVVLGFEPDPTDGGFRTAPSSIGS